MTRDNIVSLISKETSLSQVAVNKVIDSLFDNIERALMRDERIQFTGFGTFEPKKPYSSQAVITWIGLPRNSRRLCKPSFRCKEPSLIH